MTRKRELSIAAIVMALCLTCAAVAFGAFLGGPIGDQPTVTPQLRVVSPLLIHTNQPITVKIAYKDFDLEPQLRCGPAGPCTGSLPQTVTADGHDIGHIHVYLQKVTGQFATQADSDSFCIPADVTLGADPYSGTVTGTCPAVTDKGLYRVAAEFQSNSHVSALKATNKPQDMPTTDNVYALAIG